MPSRARGSWRADETQELLAALDGIAQRAEREPAWLDASGAEDIHHFVEMALIEQLGPLGAKLHTGRSRNELIATDFRLFVKDAAAAMRRALGKDCWERLWNRRSGTWALPCPA